MQPLRRTPIRRIGRSDARRSRCDDGMSLAEVLVALLLIGLVLASMVAALVGGLRSVQHGNGYVIATQLVNERLETLRTRVFTAVAPAGTATTATTTESPVVRNGISYTLSWTSTWVDSPCNNSSTSARDYLRLQVQIQWRIRNGALRTLSAETLRAPSPVDGTAFTPVRVDTLTC